MTEAEGLQSVTRIFLLDEPVQRGGGRGDLGRGAGGLLPGVTLDWT